MSRYWLQIPRENPRAGSYSPVPHVTPAFQNRSKQNETHLGETIHAEPEQDRESVRDEEQGTSSEDEYGMEQLQPATVQEELHAAHQENSVPTLQPEHQVPLRQSTRERRPSYVFTYPSLGQPATHCECSWDPAITVYLPVSRYTIPPPLPTPVHRPMPLPTCCIPSSLWMRCHERQ